MAKKSDLPYGSEFTPNVIDIVRLLQITHDNEGDLDDLVNDFYNEYFSSRPTTEENKRIFANNCMYSMRSYQLLDDEGALTELGTYLLSLKDDMDEFHKEFTKHILLNLKGLQVIQTVFDMQSHDEKTDLQNIARWLDERGIYISSTGKYLSTMRLWFSQSGLVGKRGWEIDNDVLESILDAGEDELDELSSFNPEQKAFLKTLAILGDGNTFQSNEIAKMARDLYGVRFDDKSFASKILNPLQDAGYIIAEKTTVGRGGKPFLVHLTDKIKTELINPLIESLESPFEPEFRYLLRKPLNEILEEVGSSDRHIKGLALEALGFYIMRLLDLKYIATRLKGDQTSGAEVDLIFEGTRLIFSRWQIQCKNTAVVSVDDVAKEVGLTIQLKSNVILVITTGRISSTANKFAEDVHKSTNLNILFLDSSKLEKIAENPIEILNILNKQAMGIMEIKAL